MSSALNSPQQVKEINALIEQIEKALKPGMEIGAQSKTILPSLLVANKIDKKAKFFPCKREYSDKVVAHFVTEKKLTKSKFHRNAQDSIFLL